eukprot:471899_1
MQSNFWECSICSYQNRPNDIFCEMCDGPKINTKQTQPDNQNKSIEPHISDTTPLDIKPIYINYKQKTQNNSIQGIENIKDDNKTNENEWKCPVCTFANNINLPYCEVCFYQKTDNNNSNNTTNIDNDSRQQQNQYIEQKYDTHDNINIPNIIQTKHDISQSNEHINDKFIDDETATLLLIEQLQKQDQQQHLMINNNNITENKNEIFQSDENNINNDTATLLLIEQLQQEDQERQLIIENDIRAAKHLDEKYQKDECDIKQDYKFALQIQKELAKDTIAWFCDNCFTMNLDPTSNICSKCLKAKPKPKIIVLSTPTLKNKMSMKIIDMARKYHKDNSCIINIKHTLAFISKYYEMSKRLGANKCKPQICYHWTRKRNFEAIKKQSLKVPDGQKLKHQTDVGYYGKGIYTSNDPQFAKAYGHGANKLFVCLCINGNMYPAKYPTDKGSGLKLGYDMHYSGDNKDGEMGKQWVYFDTKQLLLIYLVTLNQIKYILPMLNEISAYIHGKYKELSKSVENAKDR